MSAIAAARKMKMQLSKRKRGFTWSSASMLAYFLAVLCDSAWLSAQCLSTRQCIDQA
jgi:hypothetical protein